MNKYEFELKKQRWMTLDNVLSRLSKWVPICIICWLGYLSIEALAGKATLTQFGFWIVADLKINKVFSHIVTNHVWLWWSNLWIQGAQAASEEY